MKSMMLALILAAPAAQATEINFGYGLAAREIPAPYVGSFRGNADKISRVLGGENVVIEFVNPVKISRIRLSAVGSGAVLIRGVWAQVDGRAGLKLPKLFDFYQRGNGTPENHGGLDLLAGGEFVEQIGNAMVQNLTVQMEGFRSDDSGLVISLTSVPNVTNADVSDYRPDIDPNPFRGPGSCIDAPCLPGPGDEDGSLCTYPVAPQDRCPN
ncbi:MAG: hypothetical protein ACXVB9_18845 [Bdellovibrionota bacterium]